MDLQALNKGSVRETHHTIPPAKQARSFPRNQIKTVTDAWNGYHSIPINAEDRDKLTFITEDGRVNQVAHYGQLVGAMAPFKSLLSPKTPFQWSDQLEESFVNSKKAIILTIPDGVEIFDPARKTCLQTDFSKQGLGYWLIQKHCDCRVDKLECCDNGWRVTLAGSRFLRDAESRYAPN